MLSNKVCNSTDPEKFWINCDILISAYKTVLHSYGLDSNPGSDEEGSDLEVMDVSISLEWIL